MKSLLLLLFSISCFSQGKILTLQQIDSIAEANGRWYIADSVINSEKKFIENTCGFEEEIVLKGRGGSTTKTFLNYYNQEYYEKLTREEKKRYNREQDAELVKATFSENLFYEDKSGKKIYAQFYYRNYTLFHAKVKYTLIFEGGKEETQDFELDRDDVDDPRPIKNTLLFDVKPWITNKNKEILQNHKV